MFKSAYEEVGGMVYFARMVEKIRMHARGELPEEYVGYLGGGFDGRCVEFLGVSYEDVRKLVLDGETDDVVLEWCERNGMSRSGEEKLVWNEFMMKRGWRDSGSSAGSFQQYKDKYGLGERGDIKTYFDFFEVDEGRST
ncbi:MAG: DUF5069 domain-containing protein [Akkermansiaceae bacterium]